MSCLCCLFVVVLLFCGFFFFIVIGWVFKSHHLLFFFQLNLETKRPLSVFLHQWKARNSFVHLWPHVISFFTLFATLIFYKRFVFSKAAFLMMNEFKDFSTVMVFHQLEQSWRQETHIIGKKLVLLVRNLYNQLENFDHSGAKPALVVKKRDVLQVSVLY